MVIKKVKKIAGKKTASKKTPGKKKISVRLSPIKRQTALEAPVKSKQKFALALQGKEVKNISGQSVHEHDFSKVTQPRFTFQDNFSLPTNYNATSLTLIARDPYWIYAYWEIAPKAIEELRQRIGDQVNQAAYVLRLYEISFVDFNGTNANHYFDMDVGPFTNSWYINLWSDKGVYCADLGLRAPDGKFYKIARSNFISTPRAVSSPRSDLVWMEVKEEEAPAAYVELKSKKGATKSRQRGFLTRRIYLTDREIFEYYSRHFYILKQILVQRLSHQELENLHHSPESLGGAFSLDNILQGRFTQRQFLKKIRSGSSEDMTVEKSVLEQMPGGKNVSEQMKVVEEGASIRETVKKHGFFFEIGTELIVYGRTEPDAKVTLEGKLINLRSDGTFSLRYILNDTKIPLGFKAYSSNGIDQRSISTAVERIKTIYRDNA